MALSHHFHTLEIGINRDNDKGISTARDVLENIHKEFALRKKSVSASHGDMSISFFILRTGGQIRFFMEVPEEEKSFLERTLYTHYPDIEVREVPLPLDAHASFLIREGKLRYLASTPLKISDTIDPLTTMTLGLARGKKEYTSFIRIDFTALSDKKWKSPVAKKILSSRIFTANIKSTMLQYQKIVKIVYIPIQILYRAMLILLGRTIKKDHTDGHHAKWDHIGFSSRIIVGSSDTSGKETDEIMAGFSLLNEKSGEELSFTHSEITPYHTIPREFSTYRNILSLHELAEIVHFPTRGLKTPGIDWISTRKFEPPHNLPLPEAPNTPLGISEFRGKREGFGIKPLDRSRHLYIIGKTGMGKSTLLENMIYADILAGRGVALIDPHGDLADTVLANIPKSRTNDIIFFDPSDTEYPIGFNMLDCPKPELRPIVAGGVVSVFKRMFGESWGPRLEYILRNTLLTLLEIPETTLISVVLMLTQESYRKKIVSKISDPILIQFWNEEFGKMSPQMMSEAVNPILNKVGQFLSSPIVRNIVGQPKNPFSLRWIMDNSKILIVNLSKGKIGEDASSLLGSMIVTKFQIEAMSRADIPENERKDFGLYVDEFQNFATDSFATILSEARKYQLSLTMANQYVAQMTESVQNAVFGNVGTMISFQVGPRDASILKEVFGGETVISTHDLMNLRKYDIYTKLLIDGMPSPVFSAATYGPIRTRMKMPEEQSKEVLLRVSREKYTKKRDFVEKKIFEYAGKIGDDEKKYRKEKEEAKALAKSKKPHS